MKYLFKLFFILSTFLLTNKLVAQDYGHNGIDFIIGYQKQNFHTLEIGIAHGSRGDELGSLYYRNYHLGGELLFNNKNPIVGFKAGYTHSWIILNFTGQAIYYTDFDKSTFAIRPELGLTLAGAIDLTYGYNLFLLKEKLNINNGVLSLRLTLGRTLFQ